MGAKFGVFLMGGVTVGDCSLWRLCKLDTAKIPEAHKVGDRESNELSR